MAQFLDCAVPEPCLGGCDFLAPSLTTWHCFIFFFAKDSWRHTWFQWKKRKKSLHTWSSFLQNKNLMQLLWFCVLFFDQISHMFLTWLGCMSRFIYISRRNIHRLYQQLSEQRQTFLGAMWTISSPETAPLGDWTERLSVCGCYRWRKLLELRWH